MHEATRELIDLFSGGFWVGVNPPFPSRRPVAARSMNNRSVNLIGNFDGKVIHRDVVVFEEIPIFLRPRAFPSEFVENVMLNGFV